MLRRPLVRVRKAAQVRHSSTSSASPTSRKSGSIVLPLIGGSLVLAGAFSGAALYASSDASFRATWIENAAFTGGQASIDAVVALKDKIRQLDAKSIETASTDALKSINETKARAEQVAADAQKQIAAAQEKAAQTLADAQKAYEATKNTVTSTYDATVESVTNVQKTVTSTANAAFETIESKKEVVEEPKKAPVVAEKVAPVKAAEPEIDDTPIDFTPDDHHNSAAEAAALTASVVVAETVAEKKKEKKERRKQRKNPRRRPYRSRNPKSPRIPSRPILETLGRQNETALQALSEQERELAEVFHLALKDQAAALEAEKERALQALQAQKDRDFDASLHAALVKESEKIKLEWQQKVKELVDNERDGRLARLDHLAMKIKYLEEIAVRSGEYVERMQGVQRLIAAVQGVKAKVEEGGAFKKELAVLQDAGRVVSFDELKQDFQSLATKIRRVQLMPADGGPVSYALSWSLSHLLIQKHGLVPGSDVESVLARAQFYLGHGDLESAAREVNQLQGWSGSVAKDWVKEARKVLEVQQALEGVEGHVALKNLGVV
ncbi:hypothetical protein BCR33DRAFT_785670 [Rhizoclosmatium globosum]|uniref:MICOS complex subunit MIC60 n=1 Tax=Rhizoclosmatium globosum TaxID=329046 RepID=A0A1Y2CAE9_9FUNG|nr:hypothetical protein BCR33DRAFT_785670 [Rhizoclosmatium globosum]|eukprot:ORY43877.1 hypothetical protein BCR33DRAFT_785670 [Rhizoclosmatium globosum]